MQLLAPPHHIYLLLPILLLPLLTHAKIPPYHPAAAHHNHPRAAALPHSTTDTTSYSTTYLTTPSTTSTTLSPTGGVPDVSVGVDVAIVTGWGYPCDGSCTWEAQVATSTTRGTHTWWKTREEGGASSWVSVPTAPASGAVLVGGSVATGKPYVGQDEGKKGEGEVHCDASGHCSEG